MEISVLDIFEENIITNMSDIVFSLFLNVHYLHFLDNFEDTYLSSLNGEPLFATLCRVLYIG